MKAPQLITRLLILIGVAACIELFVYANRDANTQAPVEAVHDQHPLPTLNVSHTLKQDDLHLKLNVTGFTFSLENMGKDNRYGEGHVHLYLDGKKVAKIFEPQYVLKDIPPGRHEVVVELAHNNHESYGVQQKLQIDVKP
ncbi:hypothetical protein QO009_001044 [Brevibacillus aydinogluensis]|jgi:hypothetical protein|uniref:hypothetical protein n=1 Tax=Brevibacillus TaxID=55080 RepID=UPI001B99A682|nr:MULTISPECIES: hypothetical protein [Brevibacillus]MBR8659158.1 hypothetical protein [Brevibacillus sp. NL20B1]MDT3415188.1 hypothetical protein [Brevibacillus aydinogluensis]